MRRIPKKRIASELGHITYKATDCDIEDYKRIRQQTASCCHVPSVDELHMAAGRQPANQGPACRSAILYFSRDALTFEFQD